MVPRRHARRNTNVASGCLRLCKVNPWCRWGCIIAYLIFQSLVLILFHLKLRKVDVHASVNSLLSDFVANDRPKIKATQYQHQQQQQRQRPAISEQEREASLAYVNSFQNLERPLKFFHIPKTAGTAIEFAAGENAIPWGSCLFNHKPKRDICKYPSETEWPQHIGWWHLPTQLFPLANIDPYQDAERFAVRDPYDRAVSEFYYICTLKVFDWRPDQCQRERLFEKGYMNQWLRDKMEDTETIPALTYLTDNGHFTPQYEFIFGPNDVRMVDYVLRLDDTLSVEFSRLMEAFSMDQVQLKKLNALGAEARDSDKHLTVNDLDEDTLNSIHKIYPRDFDLGYEKKEL
jgi:hypothetical protein